MQNNPVSLNPTAIVIPEDKKAWFNPELILIAKDDIEANNPFAENDHHILS